MSLADWLREASEDLRKNSNIVEHRRPPTDYTLGYDAATDDIIWKDGNNTAIIVDWGTSATRRRGKARIRSLFRPRPSSVRRRFSRPLNAPLKSRSPPFSAEEEARGEDESGAVYDRVIRDEFHMDKGERTRGLRLHVLENRYLLRLNKQPDAKEVAARDLSNIFNTMVCYFSRHEKAIKASPLPILQKDDTEDVPALKSNGSPLPATRYSYAYESACEEHLLAMNKSRINLFTWHRRLAHLSVQDCIRMSKMVDGMDVKGLAVPKHACFACRLAQAVNATAFECLSLVPQTLPMHPPSVRNFDMATEVGRLFPLPRFPPICVIPLQNRPFEKWVFS
ncbi:hypothetical protein BP00DRAFT_459324 [Aspergillus indologenus CBS 114.80]|uniref:GAG-pre-integrase domain-containing protein n=1 Tax=Aspergillus indologenus CBS 114.80 TaxID=1450541 RepID=A0A2V5HXF2_9EURO|nr:hypothetical protein BP00DRAFT_459324 [Aspergillus indologenus CBS 114.80]